MKAAYPVNYFPRFLGKNIKNCPPSKLFLFTSLTNNKVVYESVGILYQNFLTCWVYKSRNTGDWDLYSPINKRCPEKASVLRQEVVRRLRENRVRNSSKGKGKKLGRIITFCLILSYKSAYSKFPWFGIFECLIFTFFFFNLLAFYFILFYFILFYFILFYFILFYFILFYFILNTINSTNSIIFWEDLFCLFVS